jgi:hypothetical protein
MATIILALLALVLVVEPGGQSGGVQRAVPLAASPTTAI